MPQLAPRLPKSRPVHRFTALRGLSAATLLGAAFAFGASGAGCISASLPAACEGAETSCSFDLSAVVACDKGGWAVPTACQVGKEHCIADAAGARCGCFDGAIGCSPDRRELRTCVDGAWQVDATCGDGEVCSPNLDTNDGACQLARVACDPLVDRERCRVIVTPGDPAAKYTADVYSCGRDGIWHLQTACSESEVCIMQPASADDIAADPLKTEVGHCQSIPCTEGVESCPSGSAHGNPYVCRNGALVQTGTCSAGQACVVDLNGHAGCLDLKFPCGTDAEWCDPDGNVWKCASGQSATLLTTCAAEEVCTVNHGAALCVRACVPGEQQCTARGTVQTCDAGHFWVDSETCTATQECVVAAGQAHCRTP